MEKVVVVVVSYNRKELLKECLAALLAQTYPDMHILLIDNNSTDGTEDYIRESGYMESEQFTYAKLSENIGGAGGFHEGVKRAMQMKADWIWVMDDDTIPEPDALSELMKATGIVGSDKIAFLSSNVYGMSKEPMNVPRMKMFQKGSNGYADWNCKLEHGLVKVNTATFCSMMFSREAVRKVGLPIRSYFIWGDDTEYSLRLSKYVGQAWLVGKSKVLHKRANEKALSIIKEDNPNRIRIYYYYIRNYLINLRLYYGFLAAMAKLGHFWLMMLQALFTPKCRYRFKKIGVLFKGTSAFLFRRYDYKEVKHRMEYVEETVCDGTTD